MSIDFDGLVIEGFMPFVKSFELKLANRGLVFIIGENKVSRMADSNGAGKTALLDAFSWVHYDQILRGTSAARIINRHCDKAVVESYFAIGKQKYCAQREQEGRKRAWTLYSLIGSERKSEGSGEQIEELFGLSFKAFANSLLFGADVLQRFAKLSDAPRKQIFDDLIDTAFFQDKRKGVELELKDIMVDFDKLVNEHRALMDVLEHEQLERDDLRRRVDLEVVDGIKSWFSDQVYMLSAMASLDELYMSWARWRKLNSYFRGMLHESTGIFDTAYPIQKQLDEIERQIARILKGKKDALAKDICPVCRRQIHPGEHKTIEEHFNRELDPLLLRGRQLRLWLKDLLIIGDRLHDQGAAIVDTVPIDEIRVEMRRQFEDLRTMEAALETDTESLDEVLRLLEERMDETDQKLAKVEQDRKLVQGEVDLREFWLEGFGHKGLKAMLLRDYEAFINERLSRYASVLTADEIQLIFAAHKQLKSGDLREEITFEALNKYGAECYDDLSSGEKQRVDLCFVLAVQDLVRELHHGHFSLALYDEIFEHFDETGCESVMDFLTQQRRTFGSVFVISHNPKLLGYPSDAVIKVVKTKEGSVVYEQ